MPQEDEESRPEQLYMIGQVGPFLSKLTASLTEKLHGFDVQQSEDSIVATPNKQPEPSFRLHVELSLLNNRVKLKIRNEILNKEQAHGELSKEILAAMHAVGLAVKDCQLVL